MSLWLSRNDQQIHENHGANGLHYDEINTNPLDLLDTVLSLTSLHILLYTVYVLSKSLLSCFV
jgi:hypothetical protein